MPSQDCKQNVSDLQPTWITHLPLWVWSPHTHLHHHPLRSPHATTHQHCHHWHLLPLTIHQTLHYEERGCTSSQSHTTHWSRYMPRDQSSSTFTSCAWTWRASRTQLCNLLYRESPASPWSTIILNFWCLMSCDPVIFNTSSTTCVRSPIPFSCIILTYDNGHLTDIFEFHTCSGSCYNWS